MTISVPKNPIKVAVHLWSPTCSPKISAPIIVTTSGATKVTDTASANGTKFSPKINKAADTAAQIPRMICSFGNCVCNMLEPRILSNSKTPRNRPTCRTHTICIGGIVWVRYFACASTAENTNMPASIKSAPLRLSARLGIIYSRPSISWNSNPAALQLGLITRLYLGYRYSLD